MTANHAHDDPATLPGDPGDEAPSGTAPSGTAPSDTGPSDTGPSDTGPSDTARTDTAPTDNGPSGTPRTDTAPSDHGHSDEATFAGAAAEDVTSDGDAADGPGPTHGPRRSWEHQGGWARRELNPHVLSDTRT